MNKSIDRSLEDIVARAICRLRASRSRKRTMHDELLTHVTTVFEEEFARLGNEQAALGETRVRFGLTEELESQLQDCVPKLERLLLISEREMLMSRWFWLVAVFAVFFGPGILLPAMAKSKQLGEIEWASIALGLLITLAGVGGIGYGVARRFVSST